MAWYRTADGLSMHIKFGKGAKVPPACSARRDDGTPCAVMCNLLCDWKVGPGMTCDQPICADHAQEVAPDKHLCPAHQAAWVQWRRVRVHPV